MQTSVRHRAIALAPAILVTAGIAACGQITGLSGDHTFDLVDAGGSSVDAGMDAAKVDAASVDAQTDSPGVDAANKCSTSAIVTAQQRLASFNGTAVCKTCLSTGCCVDVDTCSKANDCKTHLSCELDCTEKQAGPDRVQCFGRCNNGGGAPASFTEGIGSCSSQACKQECGFQ